MRIQRGDNWLRDVRWLTNETLQPDRMIQAAFDAGGDVTQLSTASSGTRLPGVSYWRRGNRRDDKELRSRGTG